ncbi:MAG: VPLPA-CTERM sorting domain-containing protein [Planctomycetaceae bacterium]
MKLFYKLLSVALCLLPAVADAGLIANGGFEDPVSFNSANQAFFTPGQSVGNPGGWVAVGNAGTNVVVLPTTYSEPTYSVTQFNAHSGNQAIDLTGGFNQGTSTGVKETVATTSGLSYHLTFWVGTATPTFGTDSASGYHDPATINLSINGSSVGSYTNSNRTNGFVNWAQFSYDFIASGSSTLVTFLNGTAGDATGQTSTSGSWYAGLDDVDLTLRSSAAVPAPASLVLALTGLPGLAMLRIRRRKSAAA